MGDSHEETRTREFLALVRQHEQALAALIRRYVRDYHAAEDTLQEALLQAWLAWDRLRDATKARAWLLQIARNRCRDYLKSARRREEPTEPEQLAFCMTRYGRDVVDRERTVQDVRALLNEVREPQRRIAELFYAEGLTIAEIARRTVCAEGTVKKRLYEARQCLREALHPDLEDPR